MHIFNDYENINIKGDQSNALIEEIITKCSQLMKENETLEHELKEKEQNNLNLSVQISHLKQQNSIVAKHDKENAQRIEKEKK